MANPDTSDHSGVGDDATRNCRGYRKIGNGASTSPTILLGAQIFQGNRDRQQIGAARAALCAPAPAADASAAEID